MANLTFGKLEDFTDETDMHHFERIYVENFPPYDRKPFAMFAQLQDRITVYVAREQQLMIAFGVVLPLPQMPAYYMSYFAVDQDKHGQGIGSRLFQYVIQDLHDNTSSQALVWEVEVPHTGDPIALSRVQFYERQGAELIAAITSYVMPTGPDTFMPMRIMWCPVRELMPPAILAQGREWIEGIYAAVYTRWPHLLTQILEGL